MVLKTLDCSISLLLQNRPIRHPKDLQFIVSFSQVQKLLETIILSLGLWWCDVNRTILSACITACMFYFSPVTQFIDISDKASRNHIIWFEVLHKECKADVSHSISIRRHCGNFERTIQCGIKCGPFITRTNNTVITALIEVSQKCYGEKESGVNQPDKTEPFRLCQNTFDDSRIFCFRFNSRR